MTATHETAPENPPAGQLEPYSGTLDPRIQLAHSIAAHRHWCEVCKPHAEQLLAALNGMTIEEITGED